MKWMAVILMSSVLILGACTSEDVDDGEDNSPAEEGMSEDNTSQDEESNMNEEDNASQDEESNMNEEDNASQDEESNMNEEDNASEEESNTGESQEDASSSSNNDELFHDVVDYELDIEFNNNDEWSYDYEVEYGGKEGEIERDGEPEIEGQEAIEEIETMIEFVEPALDLSLEEAFQRIYDHLEINQEDVSEIELEVDFSNHDSLEGEQEY